MNAGQIRTALDKMIDTQIAGGKVAVAEFRDLAKKTGELIRTGKLGQMEQVLTDRLQLIASMAR